MVIASYRSASLGGRVSGALNASAWCLGFELSGKAHVSSREVKQQKVAKNVIGAHRPTAPNCERGVDLRELSLHAVVRRVVVSKHTGNQTAGDIGGDSSSECPSALYGECPRDIERRICLCGSDATAKVRASLLNARSALSCCGIVSTCPRRRANVMIAV
jgi:hypothetical protein